ncbi:MAG: hypothetical protein CM1200mP13_09660 [Candidatus Pelagibacterales bacterium]|nr:MAG: hypothetical protein CM1200mP13_09660 [Pelagibacterales bacterium]
MAYASNQRNGFESIIKNIFQMLFFFDLDKNSKLNDLPHMLTDINLGKK